MVAELYQISFRVGCYFEPPCTHVCTSAEGRWCPIMASWLISGRWPLTDAEMTM